jgi:hypothetical protein
MQNKYCKRGSNEEKRIVPTQGEYGQVSFKESFSSVFIFVSTMLNYENDFLDVSHRDSGSKFGTLLLDFVHTLKI